jgi:hypothetical protein
MDAVITHNIGVDQMVFRIVTEEPVDGNTELPVAACNDNVFHAVLPVFRERKTVPQLFE